MPNQFELRAREPVYRSLIRRLVVPRIYFEAAWPADDSDKYDLVAIDRDGQGDAHIVQVRENAADALAQVGDLLDAQAPYRWIAFRRDTEDEQSALAPISQSGLSASGTAGRVGVMEIVDMAGGDLGANIRISAERFPGAFYALSTAFSGSHNADVQY